MHPRQSSCVPRVRAWPACLYSSSCRGRYGLLALLSILLPVDSATTSAELVDQYAEIAQLAGGLAHEIKNPLSTIRLNMELLAEDFRDSESPRDRRALRKIELVAAGMPAAAGLARRFPEFRQGPAAALQPCDLNAQVRRALDFFRPKAKEAKIEVIDYLANDLPTVLLDPEAFHGALLNLILNAEQAMPDGGQLVLRTYGTPDGVALDLIDTGCGMDEQTRSHIFDAFFSTKRGGSGLGLPTARQIVEAHGGEINLQSELGLGTQIHDPTAASRPIAGGRELAERAGVKRPVAPGFRIDLYVLSWHTYGNWFSPAENSPSSQPAMTIKTLVQGFAENIRQLKAPQYKESQVRLHYIDPFWKLLGWDVSNDGPTSAAGCRGGRRTLDGFRGRRRPSLS